MYSLTYQEMGDGVSRFVFATATKVFTAKSAGRLKRIVENEGTVYVQLGYAWRRQKAEAGCFGAEGSYE